MNRHNAVRLKKISIIISALLMLLLLCGCRTRVTNNTDVTQTLEDDGVMQETYQIRRDELGIPIAESPIFKGWEATDDEYEDYEDYYDSFESYDDEDFGDEFDEEEEIDREERTNTTPVKRQPRQPVRQPVRTSTGDIRVTLDVNAKDAKCSQSFIMVKKGAAYGALPAATRSGYELEGWYTAKKDGDKVTSKTIVTNDKAHTLYAHWEKAKEEDKEEEQKQDDQKTEEEKKPEPEPQPEPQPQPEQKTFTITFDGNSEGDSVELSSSQMTVEENGSYGSMPSAKRNKYSFTGWYTDPSGGDQITGGSKFTANADQTLYAHWSFEPYTWWDNEFAQTANSIDSEDKKVICYVDEGKKDEKDFVKSCKGRLADEDNPPAYIIKFISDFDEYDDEAKSAKALEIYNKHSESNPGVTVILISDNAYAGKEERQLLYKMKLFDALYGENGSTEEALHDLAEDDTQIYDLYIYHNDGE